MRAHFTIAALLASMAVPAAADGLVAPYDTVDLPAVTAAPWRFTQFPILAWWGPPGTATQQDFQNYKDAGFTLHATNSDTGYFQALDLCDAVGLKSMSFRQTQGFELPSDPTIVFPATRDTIVGWLVGDEPQRPVDVIAAITEVNQLQQDDPTRWAVFNMLPPPLQIAPGSAAAMDAATHFGMPILSYDDYVIMQDGTDQTIQFYQDLALARDASIRNTTPFWAFAVAIHHEGYLGWYRRPSESDLRWMQYSNLAYGAKGLWYFTYWAPTSLANFDHVAIVDNVGGKTPLYDQVSTLNHEVLGMGDVLLGLTSDKVVHTDPPFGQTQFAPGADWISDFHATSGMIGFFHDAAGMSYALVVNKRHGMDMTADATADDLVLTFAPDVVGLEAVSWLGGTAGPVMIAADHTATLHVAGGTGVLLRATLGTPSPDGGGIPDDQAPGGCCSASPGSRTGVLLGLVVLGVITRRRRAR